MGIKIGHQYLLKRLQIIGDNHLHVQEWVPDFVANEANINKLLVWVRFSVLPVEYYTKTWLERAGSRIGKILRVDYATLLALIGKFART